MRLALAALNLRYLSSAFCEPDVRSGAAARSSRGGLNEGIQVNYPGWSFEEANKTLAPK